MTPLWQDRVSRWLVLFLLVLAGGALLSATSSAQQPPPPSDSYRYRVDVQLVLVPTTVATAAGRPVTWLERDAFEVLEDGHPRPLKLFEKETGLPLQLVLLLDTSLSAASELKAEKAALLRFVERVLRPVDAAALFDFSGGVRKLADFSHDPRTLEAALRPLRPRAGTALYDAIIESSAKLKERQGRRVLVLVTDGNDTTSKHDFQAALRAAQEAEVTIFALIMRPIPGESGRSVRGEHAMITFAEMTGGRVFFPAGMTELDRFFDDLSELLRTQYLLGYQPPPTGARPEFRTIEVRVRGGDYLVQHRKGYFTGPQQP